MTLKLCIFSLVLSFAYAGALPASRAKPKDYKGSYSYSLDQYKGKNSVLLIFAPGKKDSDFAKQLEVVKNRQKDFRSKKIKIYYVFADEVGRADDVKLRVTDSRSLRRRYKVSDKDFKILLIDRSGNTKKRSERVLTNETLNSFIKNI